MASDAPYARVGNDLKARWEITAEENPEEHWRKRRNEARARNLERRESERRDQRAVSTARPKPGRASLELVKPQVQPSAPPPDEIFD